MRRPSCFDAGRATALVIVTFLVTGPVGTAWGQGPTIEDPIESRMPGEGGSLLGPAPGEGASSPLTQAAGDQTTLGGGAGVLTPRVPPSISVPGSTTSTPPPVGFNRTPSLTPATLPVFGSLNLPASSDSDGPPDGVDLDQAISRLIAVNLDLRARFYEIPQADADILTASLRANPIFFADAQLVPYGDYNQGRPGGQTQYDANLSIPLDLNNKRQARMNVAGHAKRVIEAQYQDAVRLTIDNLYIAFVDVLAARETVRFAQASVDGYNQTLKPIRERYDKKTIPLADVNRVQVQRDFALIGLTGAEETLLKTKQTLAALLNVPPDQAEVLEVRGRLRNPEVEPPPSEALVQTALASRPDLIAFRIGIQRACADVQLAYKNRYADVYWLVQPYTFQDNQPQGLKSSHSWATGVTVPLPLLNRNQGNIRRAQINVDQTRVELAALERQVYAEVRNADKDYRVTRAAIARIETDLLPAAAQVLQTSRLNYQRGNIDVVAFLSAQRDYNEVVRQYRDLLVQGRRGALKLNTVVGQRIMP
jgi:cobalt-zinc-cadmium efflux system outer membrane protein